jgi:hypothetical protein
LIAGSVVALPLNVADKPDRERGAQEEKPGDREAKHAPSTRQDFTRPTEGRDVPPSDEIVKGNRNPKSPWMGGG